MLFPRIIPGAAPRSPRAFVRDIVALAVCATVVPLTLTLAPAAHASAAPLPLRPFGLAHTQASLLTPSVHRAVRRSGSRRAVATVDPLSAPRAQMLALINAERAQAGVGALHLDATLDRIAEGRSQDMVSRHYFSHQIPGVGYVFNILDRSNVPYQMAGENIALNNYIVFESLRQTVQDTNSDLMHSPEHRSNLLERAYSALGLGLAFDPANHQLILTEVFVQR